MSGEVETRDLYLDTTRDAISNQDYNLANLGMQVLSHAPLHELFYEGTSENMCSAFDTEFKMAASGSVRIILTLNPQKTTQMKYENGAITHTIKIEEDDITSEDTEGYIRLRPGRFLNVYGAYKLKAALLKSFQVHAA